MHIVKHKSLKLNEINDVAIILIDNDGVVKTATKKVVTYASIQTESRGLWGRTVVCYGGISFNKSLICNDC